MEVTAVKAKFQEKWLQLIPIILIGFLVVVLSKLSLFTHAEHKLLGLIHSPSQNSNSDLVVIEYTEDSINRAQLAGLLQSFSEHNTKSVLLDINLSEIGENTLDDDILSNTLKANNTTKIILPIYKIEDKRIRPLASFRKYTKTGFIDLDLDKNSSNKPIKLSFNTSANSDIHAIKVQLGNNSNTTISTLIEPGISLDNIIKYSFKESQIQNAETFKNKHILIGPNTKRTNNHALLFLTLQEGEVNQLESHIIFSLFLVLSLALLILFASNMSRTKIIFASAAIAMIPIVINLIAFTLFRTLLPSFLLLIGLSIVILLLIYLNRDIFDFSIKTINLNSSYSRNNGYLQELLEGELSIGKNGVVLKADPIAIKLLGMDDQSIVGTPIRKLSPSIKQDRWRTFYSELVSNEKPGENLYEIKVKHANGEKFALQLTPKDTSYVSNTVTHFILRNTIGKSGADVDLEYQAKLDRVSRALNSKAIREHLNSSIENLEKTHRLKIILLRIDNIEEIIKSLGQESSDKLIKAFTKSLYRITSGTTVIGRMENSDFLLIVKHEAEQKTNQLIEKIEKLSKNTIHTSGISIETDFRLGIADYPKDGIDSTTLIQSAKLTLLNINDDNKRVITNNKLEITKGKKPVKLLSELQIAIREKQFKLLYQPILNLADNTVDTIEALVRWEHPTKGIIQPNEFIDQIEHSKLVRPFTKLVINQALADTRELQRHDFKCTVSVNISERNLLDAHFPIFAAECINNNKMRSENIEFEISEKNLHLIPEQSVNLLQRLKKHGINFSLDNYGTENSSILNLRELPFNKIKIHKSLVSKIIKSAKDEIIIDAIIRLAHGFNISVVAEGVETELHFKKLKQLGCDYCQGYLFSKPINIGSLLELYSSWDIDSGSNNDVAEQDIATWNGKFSN